MATFNSVYRRVLSQSFSYFLRLLFLLYRSICQSFRAQHKARTKCGGSGALVKFLGWSSFDRVPFSVTHDVCLWGKSRRFGEASRRRRINTRLNQPRSRWSTLKFIWRLKYRECTSKSNIFPVNQASPGTVASQPEVRTNKPWNWKCQSVWDCIVIQPRDDATMGLSWTCAEV